MENPTDPIILNYRNYFRFSLHVVDGHVKVAQDELFLIKFFYTFLRVNDPSVRHIHLKEVQQNEGDLLNRILGEWLAFFAEETSVSFEQTSNSFGYYGWKLR